MTSSKFEDIMSHHYMHEKEELKSIKNLDIFYQAGTSKMVTLSSTILRGDTSMCSVYFFTLAIEWLNSLELNSINGDTIKF